MKIEVKYTTEFGVRTSIMEFEDLLEFSKKFNIISQKILSKYIRF